MRDSGAYIIFTRIPTAGKVKTRLESNWTGVECASIQANMLADLFSKMEKLKQEGIDVFVCYSDEQPPISFVHQLPDYLTHFPQKGKDIGERMQQAIEQVHTLGYDKIVLTGSDIPRLTPNLIVDAIKALYYSDHVIAPSEDGGYYLIGTNAPICLKDILMNPNLDWGGASIYEQSKELLTREGQTVYELPALMDIDIYQDVLSYKEHPLEENAWLNKWLKEKEVHGKGAI